MRTKLMNSAMMPKPGTYRLTKCDRQIFIRLLQAAYQKGNLDNFIGYPQNLKLIKKWSGVILNPCREQTSLEPGDKMLIMKLKYRLNDPALKGREMSEDDFEFFQCIYE